MHFDLFDPGMSRCRERSICRDVVLEEVDCDSEGCTIGSVVVDVRSEENHRSSTKLWKALKQLEFNSPGPQMKAPQKKNRRRKAKDEPLILAAEMCDCTEADCPGCFFPCPKCKSNKCGVVCRVKRDWTYLNTVQTDATTKEGETDSGKET